MRGRKLFAPLLLDRRPQSLRWEIPSCSEVESRHGGRLADPAGAFAWPHMPVVEHSLPVRGTDCLHSWIRFPSPVPCDDGMAWAHVYAPDDVTDPPTVIFLHGICVESELWPDAGDPIPTLARRGIRAAQVHQQYTNTLSFDYRSFHPSLTNACPPLHQLFLVMQMNAVRYPLDPIVPYSCREEKHFQLASAAVPHSVKTPPRRRYSGESPDPNK